MIRIHIDPDLILHRSTGAVSATPELRRLAKEMLAYVQEPKHKSVGLAAPQVGQSLRLCVVSYEAEKQSGEESLLDGIFFNPNLQKTSREQELGMEGCLSLPGLEVPIWRHKWIQVEAQDEHGTLFTKRYSGYLARIIQHEIDHLDGVLITDRVEPFRVVFMGTPEFAVASLSALEAHPAFKVVQVVTETDKPAGRGQVLTPSPVKRLAEELKLPVWQPDSLQGEEVVKRIEAAAPDFLVVAAYGKILPEAVLRVAQYGAYNVHGSLLPRWRGASPVQAALLAGDTETGVTIMEMNAGLDTGRIVLKEVVKIGTDETAPSLMTHLAEVGGNVLPFALMYVVTGMVTLRDQPTKGVTVCRKLTKEAGRIDWAKPAEEIDRLVRAMTPWPGAWTELDDKRLLVLSGSAVDGRYRPSRVQLAGKTAQDVAVFERGWRGSRLPWVG